MTHKSEDYKISAVKYYLKNKDNIRKTCKIFVVRTDAVIGIEMLMVQQIFIKLLIMR